MKRHLGALVVGLLAVGGIAYAGARVATTPQTQDVTLAQDNQDVPPGEQPQREPGEDGKMRPGFHRAIRGDLVVPGDTEGTFQNVRIDRGVIERIDGSTIVIKEDDGTTVEVPTTAETRIRRDGEEAAVGDLQAGDHVHTVRVDSVTRRVGALSPERWQEMEQRREQCRANPRQCREERMRKRAERRGDSAQNPAA
jgi:hypothetical protein